MNAAAARPPMPPPTTAMRLLCRGGPAAIMLLSGTGAGSAQFPRGRGAAQPPGALVVKPGDGLAGQPGQPGLHRETGLGLEVAQMPVADREPGKQRGIEGEGARRVDDVEAVLLIDGLA